MSDASRFALQPATSLISNDIAPFDAAERLDSCPPTAAERALNRLSLGLVIATVPALVVALFVWQMGVTSLGMALVYGGTAWASTLMILLGMGVVLSRGK